jgi:hypothetical protein
LLLFENATLLTVGEEVPLLHRYSSWPPSAVAISPIELYVVAVKLDGFLPHPKVFPRVLVLVALSELNGVKLESKLVLGLSCFLLALRVVV